MGDRVVSMQRPQVYGSVESHCKGEGEVRISARDPLNSNLESQRIKEAAVMNRNSDPRVAEYGNEITGGCIR